MVNALSDGIGDRSCYRNQGVDKDDFIICELNTPYTLIPCA